MLLPRQSRPGLLSPERRAVATRTHPGLGRGPASTSAPRTDAGVATNAMASNATATGGAREDIGAKPVDNTLAQPQSVGATQVRRNCRRVAIVAPSDERSAVVRDSIDGPGVVVRDEQRAVGHLVQVRGAAPRLVVLQPSRGETLLLGRLAHGQRDRCQDIPE